MPKDRNNSGGPTQSPKDEPTPDRDFQKAQSQDELQDRSSGRGTGRRNGSSKRG